MTDILEDVKQMRRDIAAGDAKRDAGLTPPEDVTRYLDIPYGPDPAHVLDVYCPKGTDKALPTIVSIHGGGYVYGNKEIYRRNGMDKAKRCFDFVNFNYRLAPRWKFPTPLWDTNKVMEWICKNAERYHLDPDRIILVGDSAGAQLASQYAASKPASVGTVELDVSGLTGAYYVTLVAGAETGGVLCAFTATKVWLT